MNSKGCLQFRLCLLLLLIYLQLDKQCCCAFLLSPANPKTRSQLPPTRPLRQPHISDSSDYSQSELSTELDKAKLMIEDQQNQIDRLVELVESQNKVDLDASQPSDSMTEELPISPLKVMLFIDGTWLYYTLHERDTGDLSPIEEWFGRGWQSKYDVDWNGLPGLVSRALLAQDEQRGWMATSSTPGRSTRPVEVSRVLVYTSYRADTAKSSRRYQMFQNMLKAKYDVLMLETIGQNEKCVDIQLGVDMLHYATVPAAFDVALLLSGDKDYLPALARCRQKGRRVGVVSVKRYCNRAFYTTPNLKDYDMIWLDDHLDELIKPTSETEWDRVGRPKPGISKYTMMKVVSDFIVQSGRGDVSSRDIGRFLKPLKVGDHGVLDEVKRSYESLYQFVLLSDPFETRKGVDSLDFWVSVTDDYVARLESAANETQLTSAENVFFDAYSKTLERLKDKTKYYQSTLDGQHTSRPLDLEAMYLAQTVAQLKSICRNRNLPVSGVKAELVARLLQNESEEKTPIQAYSPPDPGPSDDYLEGLILKFLKANGGTGDSRELGRYLAASRPSPASLQSSETPETALTELKRLHGSLRQFISHYGTTFHYSMPSNKDTYEFQIRLSNGG